MEREELLARLAAGDEAAWREFLRDYGALIYDVPSKLGLYGDDREDVFQNVCIAVYRSIGSLRDPARLATWLYGVAYRQSVNILRRRGRELPLETEDGVEREFPSAEPPPDHMLEDFERAGQLRDALETLDPRCRRLLTAIYLEDPAWSYNEIAERFAMPIGSIGPTRARCLKKLRDGMERGTRVSRGVPRATSR